MLSSRRRRKPGESPRIAARSRRCGAAWGSIRPSVRDWSTRSGAPVSRLTSTSPSSFGKAGLTTTEFDLVVADASVLVEFVVTGRHREGADALLALYAQRRTVTLITAAHGLLEAIHTVRRMVRRGVITLDAGFAAVAVLGQLDVVLDPTAPRMRRIWSLRDSMTAYDASYAAAAEALDAPLVTVDQRLLNACRTAGIVAMSLDDFVAVD